MPITKEAVEKIYLDYIRSLENVINEHHPLIGNSCDAKMHRILLLDRDPEAETSWEEVWKARMRFDLSISNFSFDLATGSITMEEYVPESWKDDVSEGQEGYIPKDLSESIMIILASYSEIDQKRFISEGKLRDRAVSRLFGLRKDKKVESMNDIVKKLKLTYHKLREMID